METTSFDANGSMTERIDHTGTAANTYTQDFDVQNRLIQVSQSISPTVTTFDYDDTGQRTMTTLTTPEDEKKTTHYPFPGFERTFIYSWDLCIICGEGQSNYTWVLQDTISRSIYNAGGRAIATRVSGDPESGNNGLFYFHSDHLGSATFLTHGNGHANEGQKVANSTKFYTPFGEYRINYPSDPIDDVSDRGFTGHKHNDDIGLIYMNARYYLGAAGRFVSADTIIPYPNDPQSHNRFSYVRNNPINSIDPTRHINCPDPNEGCAPANTPPPDISQEEYEDTIINSIKDELSGSSQSEPLVSVLFCGNPTTGCYLKNIRPVPIGPGCTPLMNGGSMCPPDDGWQPYYADLGPTQVDYWRLSIGFATFPVGTSLITDVNGNLYVTVTVSAGVSYKGSLSVTSGHIYQGSPWNPQSQISVNPDEETLGNILTGPSMGGGGGFIIGGSTEGSFYIDESGNGYVTKEQGIYFLPSIGSGGS